jgi:hypothetical protein
MLFVALCLSAVAAFYSIVGLTAIFAAAVVPIVIMGSILEVAKLVVTVWLHEYWQQAKLTMKLYLVPAVGILMLITSMGIFGFLSKAHMDQGMVSGDVQAKIAIYDEKIRTERENIDVNRKALKQMDEAVDQVMGRSQDEKGADKAVAIRRAQQKERGRLLADIAEAQKKITVLNEERAPIAAEVRKVEAEVGPIKYIAALIYDDNTDVNVLEKAVRWVIIILVVVFDPLAVMMLLAATESMAWERRRRNEAQMTMAIVSPDEIDALDKPPTHDPHTPGWMFGDGTKPYPIEPAPSQPMRFNDPGEHPSDSIDEKIQEIETVTETIVPEKTLLEKHPYLAKPFVSFDTKPMVAKIEEEKKPVDDEDNEPVVLKQAKNLWKKDHPNDTLKEQRRLLASGSIDHLPWEDYLDDPRIARETGFGNELPKQAHRGDMFVLTSAVPTVLYKYNGNDWMQIDKGLTDQYTYNDSYIDHLIAQISSGNYDPDLLTDAEQYQIETRLNSDRPNT